MVVYAIWLTAILLGLGLILLGLFGIRGVLQGKVNLITASMILIPVLLVAILGLLFGDFTLAGIWTVVIMLVLGLLALVLSGVKGLFS